MRTSRSKITHLKTFEFNGKVQPVSFVNTTKVTPGVECDVYAFDGDHSKDLGIIRIAPGRKTPLQKVLKGDKTVEGYISGKGMLVITKLDDTHVRYVVDNNVRKPFTITVVLGEKMQCMADKGSGLVAFEVCFPPYEDGRFENLAERESMA